jgi:3-hydroxyisobutyrate dehydrogenase
LARASGLDVANTLSAVSGGAASSWMVGNVPPKIEKGDYRPGYSIRLQEKDLKLARELAEELHVECPGLTLVHSLFSAALRRGLENEASHGLIHLWENGSFEQDVPGRLA